MPPKPASRAKPRNEPRSRPRATVGAPAEIEFHVARDEFFHMGYLHHLNGDLHAAADCYVRSIELNPSPEGHTFLGKVLSQLGKIDAAIQECQRAVKLDREFGGAWNDLGAYMLEKRRFQDAFRFLQRACRAKRCDHREIPHFNLARFFIQRGMLRKAMDELRASLSVNPGFSLAREYLSKIEIQLH